MASQRARDIIPIGSALYSAHEYASHIIYETRWNSDGPIAFQQFLNCCMGGDLWFPLHVVQSCLMLY